MNEPSTTAYGIDLAGYSTGKSGFARAVRSSNKVEVTIYRNHALAKRATGDALLADVSGPEVELLADCLRSGQVLIDIPIDLQDLLEPRNSVFVWQLTKRPIDFAFDAMPALADRIGSPTARMQFLRHRVGERYPDLIKLGENLFETYPAGSLEQLGLPREGYKKQRITFDGGAWQGDVLAEIANGLRLLAPLDTTLNDDDLDACICAITGVVAASDVLETADLEEETRNRLNMRLPHASSQRVNTAPPAGYRLLRKVARSMRITVAIEETESPCP